MRKRSQQCNGEVRTGILDPLDVEVLPNGTSVRLIRSFRARLHDGSPVIVPRGFVTDFASVPRLFWRILPPWGTYSPAAVVHDYLYATGRFPRKKADQAFLCLMKALGVPRWKRTVMYWGVRLGGSIAWNAWRKRGRGRHA
jgi:hypothetical protein